MIEPATVTRAVFYGLGADGTVGANKNSVKIISEDAKLYAQGYFVYDSHKSGAQTISHLRFGPDPIQSPYLISQAGFVGIHQFVFLERQDLLRVAAPGRNRAAERAIPCKPKTWDRLLPPGAADDPRPQAPPVRHRCIEGGARGRPGRPHQHRAANLLLRPLRRAAARAGDRPHQGGDPAKPTPARAKSVVDKQQRRRRRHPGAPRTEVTVPTSVTSRFDISSLVPATAPDFVRHGSPPASSQGAGDAIPTSLMPADGTFPSGTSAYEKRNVSDTVPLWREDLCIQCGQCSFVCPHSVIRAKYYGEE